MKILLVAIVKNENRYLDEWVDYHYNLGFDQIVLCDNNDIDGEVITNDKVIVEDFVGQHKERHIKVRYYGTQQDAYNYCYKKYNEEYDWIAYLDIDEFLTPLKTDIKTYLSNLPDTADVVYINWKCYGDNGHIHYENKPVLERFTQPLNKCCNQTIKYDNVELFKSIVRGKGRCLKVYCHTCKVKGDAVDADGNKMRNFRYMHVYSPVKYDNIYIRHYVTKSVEEFFERHYQKTSATGIEYHHNSYKNCVEKFFHCNKWTQEKQDVIDKIVERNPIIIKRKIWVFIDKLINKLKGNFIYFINRIDYYLWKN